MPFTDIPTYRKISEATTGGRARWQTVGALTYQDLAGGVWVVPEGFETDFASVPRLPMAYWLTGDTAHHSATLHDWLCRHPVAGGVMAWGEAADLFREAMRAEGVPGWRCWLMHKAVKYLGNLTKGGKP